jgi:hypothetical protein
LGLSEGEVSIYFSRKCEETTLSFVFIFVKEYSQDTAVKANYSSRLKKNTTSI